MKDYIIAGVFALTIIISAVLVKTGLQQSSRMLPNAYSLYGYEGILYRLNEQNGRLDVLVPSNEAALLFPVGQIQLPGPKEKLSDEQKSSFSQNIKTLSQYIQMERSRSLGLTGTSSAPAPQKQ
jgi:hypothetical protein